MTRPLFKSHSTTLDAADKARAPLVRVDSPFESKAVETRDGSSTLYHPVYAQTYHSHHGAITESKHVFLGHSALEDRLAQGPVQLLEIGIGTGLNLALSATLAQRRQGVLHYLGVEQFPPETAALEQLDYGASEDIDDALWTECLRHFAQRSDRWSFFSADDSPESTVSCHWGRFEDLTLPVSHFELVYHDAFSPDVNPECWTAHALQRITDAMVPGGVLVTYTVQGDVRRALARCGLIVERLPGPPGGKRQVLRATKPHDSSIA